MKQENSQILDKLGKDSGFKTPDGFFEDFAQNMMEKLPEVKIEEKEVKKPTLWDRVRPFVYMAAAVSGVWCMIQVFNNFNGNGKPGMADDGLKGNAGATMVGEGQVNDTMHTNYKDSVMNEGSIQMQQIESKEK